MTETTAERARAETAGPRELVLAGKLVRIEPVSARKGNVAFALIRRLEAIAPELTKAYGRFVTEYGDANAVELDRVQARMRYPARPLVDAVGSPIREPAEVANPAYSEGGEEPQTMPNPRAGELILIPSPVDTISEEDWQATGGRLKLPQHPSKWEVAAALLPRALELAEDEVYRLLVLFTMSNEDVKAARKTADGGIMGELERRTDELVDDAMFDELLELAVAASDVVEAQFRRRIEGLGDGLGKLLRLVGLDRLTPPSILTATMGGSTGEPSTPTSESDGASSSSSPSTTPTSSTSSPASTAEPSAPPTTSSTPTSTSSEPSTDDSPATPSEPTPPATAQDLEPTASLP